MPELDPWDVVRGGALAFSDGPDLIGGDEQKRRLLVDEATDEPGASDPIDTSSFPGDPLHQRAPFMGVCTGIENVADPFEAAPLHTTATVHSPARGSVIVPT